MLSSGFKVFITINQDGLSKRENYQTPVARVGVRIIDVCYAALASTKQAAGRLSVCLSVCPGERTNERTNERMNERTSENQAIRATRPQGGPGVDTPNPTLGPMPI